jgi:hypothetical protein
MINPDKLSINVEELAAQLAAKTAECEKLREALEFDITQFSATEDRTLALSIGLGVDPVQLLEACQELCSQFRKEYHPTPPGLGEKILALALAGYRLTQPIEFGRFRYYAFATVDGDCQGGNCIAKIGKGETTHADNCEVGNLFTTANGLTPEDLKALGVG